MSSIQSYYYISALVILPLIWQGGGQTERTGATMYLFASIASVLTQGFWLGDLRWAVALVDLFLLAGLIYLALRKDRWWPLMASAFQTLTLLIYIATAVQPELSARTGVVATWALSFIILYSLLGGVLERILAGEAPASASAIWRRRRPAPL